MLLHWQNTDLLRFFQGNFWVTAANLGFSFLSMFHLAYLGIMFGGDTEVQEKVTFCLILRNIILDGLNYPPLPAQQHKPRTTHLVQLTQGKRMYINYF